MNVSGGGAEVNGSVKVRRKMCLHLLNRTRNGLHPKIAYGMRVEIVITLTLLEHCLEGKHNKCILINNYYIWVFEREKQVYNKVKCPGR